MKDVLPWLAVIGIIVYFSLKEGCNSTDEVRSGDTLLVVVESQRDTSTTIFSPTIPTQEIHFDIPPLQSFDSASLYRLLDNYFVQRIYKDSISNDTIYVGVETTVQENKVTSTKVDWKVKLPFRKTFILPPEPTRTIPELKTMIGGDGNHFVAAFGLGLKHRRGYDFGAMYDVVNKGVYLTFDKNITVPRLFKKREPKFE